MKEIYKEEKWKGFEILVRDVVGAMEDARLALDIIQDAIKIDMGAEITSRVFHNQAHYYPHLFDKFGEALRTKNLNNIYPGTAEYTVEIDSLDVALEQTFLLMDKVDAALFKFSKHSEQNDYSETLAGHAKKLLKKHDKSRVQFLEIHKAWQNMTLGIEDNLKFAYLPDMDQWIVSRFNPQSD